MAYNIDSIHPEQVYADFSAILQGVVETWPQNCQNCVPMIHDLWENIKAEYEGAERLEMQRVVASQIDVIYFQSGFEPGHTAPVAIPPPAPEKPAFNLADIKAKAAAAKAKFASMNGVDGVDEEGLDGEESFDRKIDRGFSNRPAVVPDAWRPERREQIYGLEPNPNRLLPNGMPDPRNQEEIFPKPNRGPETR